MQSQDGKGSPYPVETWRLSEHHFDVKSNMLGETLFTVGNGYLGLRGSHEEQYSGPADTSHDGTYLNGFYESEPIQYPETAYGLAQHNQFMLNVPNAKRIDLYLEDERLDLVQGKILFYERTLDFRDGVLTRSVEWESPAGRRVQVLSRRMVSFENKHLFAIEYTIHPINFAGRVTVVSLLDGSVRNMEAADDPRLGSRAAAPALQLIDVVRDGAYAALVHRTPNSGFTLVSAVETTFSENGPRFLSREAVAIGQRVEQRYTFDVRPGQTVLCTKVGAYYTSRDYPEIELLARAHDTVLASRQAGFETLYRQQKAFLSDFWAQADVEISGDDALQQGVRFNEFHLLQSVGRDGKTNISAKGLTGEGYEGHYFWDSEIYIFPFLLFTRPDIARKLLEYRYQGLDQARTRARQMSHAKGALYPWRTIGGEECSAYFPAGTAQYHFQADITHSIKLYAEATGDESFLITQGAEIVMETARIWMGIGAYIEQKGGKFCINEVTGPDEYTALVDNNYYTNAMARMHLQYAAALAAMLREDHAGAFEKLSRRIDLEPHEPGAWQEAADQMYLPYHQGLAIHPQDDTFLAKKPWDLAATPAEKFPLLLHYHPLVIYRHQVCKQADVVLALLLLGDSFSLDEKRRDFDYYEAVTTHDSSLSSCIFGIVAAEIGYAEKAYSYFMETARTDLENTQRNTEVGVHTAAMAGTWLGITYGFAGMRVYNGALQFSPTIPARWSRYSFRIRFHQSELAIEVRPDSVTYTLLAGDGVTFSHRTSGVRLSTGQPVATLA